MCAATAFSSCSDDEDDLKGTFMIAYNQNLIGRWVYDDYVVMEFHKDGTGLQKWDYDDDDPDLFTWTYSEDIGVIFIKWANEEDGTDRFRVRDGYILDPDNERYYKI